MSESLRFKVAGMDCPECAKKIKKALKRAEPQAEVEVYLTAGEVKVTSPETLDPEDIYIVLENTGYPAKHLDPESSGGQREKTTPVWRSPRAIATGIGAVFLLAGLGLEFLFVELNPQLLELFGHWLQASDFLLLAAIAVSGLPVIRAGYHSYRNLNLDVDLLMGTAIVAATAIGFFDEAATLAVLYSIAELLEQYSMNRTRRSLRELVELSPDQTRLLKNGEEETIPAEQLSEDDRVAVRPGEKIPVDGEVVEGNSAVDQSPITGESVPVDKSTGDPVYAGTLNESGYLEVEATKEASDSTLNNIIRLVREAEADRTPTEQFVDRFASVYTPVIVGLALVAIFFPPLALGWSWSTWFVRGLMLIVISCPCAFVISTPVTVTSGITAAAKNGVLIKGGTHLENTARTGCVVFDKTGTLTTGQLKVEKLIPLKGADEEELLRRAAALEERSEHPLGRAILQQAEDKNLQLSEVVEFKNHEGLGITGKIKNTETWVGRLKFGKQIMEDKFQTEPGLDELEQSSRTVVYVGTEEKLLGAIAISDQIRPDARKTVNNLRELGIERILMLTGDNEATAGAVAGELGLDDYRAELLPEEKVEMTDQLEEEYGRVLMVGDGVNDAPALAKATVGVAMGAAGSDTAIETADISLMADELDRLPYLVQLGRKAGAVIKQNIWSSLLVKLLLAVGVPFGYITVALAVLIGDMGMSLAVTTNALRLGSS